MVRALFLVALLCAGQAARAGECGPSIDPARLEALGGELQRGVSGLLAHGESLSSKPESNSVNHLVQELVILQERLSRLVMLAEIRDAMRHQGEQSFVQFKLSHEASLLQLASSRAHGNVAAALAGRPGIEQGVARLLEAIAQAKGMFAACDSPM